ncbi:MAG: hypothetical protein QOH42_808 [Blastocatellia bacterium]|jgi:hypothetical protein|nr:hypothetical protein [Blastocatellia bacterium]
MALVCVYCDWLSWAMHPRVARPALVTEPGAVATGSNAQRWIAAKQDLQDVMSARIRSLPLAVP